MAAELWLTDELGRSRNNFTTGETIFVAGHGLAEHAMCRFRRSHSDGRAEILATYVADRHGTLPNTVLIPYAGLAGDGGIGNTPLARLLATSDTQRLTIDAQYGENSRTALGFDLGGAAGAARPRLFSCDAEGRLQTGIEFGRGAAAVALDGFPAGCIRLFVVRRRFGWRVGDPIEPAVSDGRSHVLTIRHDGARHRVVPLHGERLRPGAYQFIARAYPPGWFEADADHLLETDVVSDRRFASLVVRWSFGKRFGSENGVVLTPQIAGRPLAHQPYFRFVDNFPKGTDVYAALDPDALPAGLIGRRAAIYVIRHKTAAQWAASTALQDISGPAMTPAPKIVPIVPGCVNWNETLVWANPQVPGAYDIVIDFGNNAANPVDFATDAMLDPPLDMIDGYVRTGFWVTEDPSLPGPYAGAIGQHDYQAGTISVPSTDAGPTPTDSLPLSATMRYPAVSGGIDAPFAAGLFPLVVVMHGNSGYTNSYLGYDYLLDHLASHGFVAMSIYAPVGVMIETRARAILAHIDHVSQLTAAPGLFHGHVDLANIGIAGHSRGGEAVVRAARINAAEALGWNIRAAISIAPTDYFHYGQPGVPLLVIYGANDGDVSGSWPDRTCFNIYDEAGRPRSFVFVYGATHDQFNTIWAPTFLSVESDIAPTDVPNLISLSDHENVAKGYVAAFMQAHLQGRDEQLEYFRSGLKPSLTAGLHIHVSHQEAGATVLDDFENLPHDPASNSLGGGVTSAALTGLSENGLRTLDSYSPHVTSGAAIGWASSAGAYISHVPPADKDVSARTTLGFRITQTYGGAGNPVGQSQDLFVRLTDGSGRSRAIRTSTFTDIPYPYVRGHVDLIKSAMKSVRIPLASFAIANAGQQDVDLTDLVSVAFEFDANATGAVQVDDIEFGS